MAPFLAACGDQRLLRPGHLIKRINYGVAFNQNLTVVQHQGRDARQWVVLFHIVRIVEDGSVEMFVWHAKNIHRDRHAADEWRAKASYQFHFSLPS